MADREKVIEELERLSEWFFLQYQVVYDGDAPNYYDAYKTVDDALALLKEQEAETGHWIDSAGDDKCSVCGATYSDLYPDYQYTHYCPNCGAKMEGR